jgi:hypothetical protein
MISHYTCGDQSKACVPAGFRTLQNTLTRNFVPKESLRGSGDAPQAQSPSRLALMGTNEKQVRSTFIFLLQSRTRLYDKAFGPRPFLPNQGIRCLREFC